MQNDIAEWLKSWIADHFVTGKYVNSFESVTQAALDCRNAAIEHGLPLSALDAAAYGDLVEYLRTFGRAQRWCS